MKVEIVSVGKPLLMSDVLDTNTGQVTRSLREIDVQLTCKVTVGDDLPILVDVLQVAMQRAQVVLVIGSGNGSDRVGIIEKALVTLEAEGVQAINCLTDDGDFSRLLATAVPEDAESIIICLPAARRELSYALENRVLPYLRLLTSREQPEELESDWILLRTVGMMESSIRQQLADLDVGQYGRITLQSYAGLTDVRLLTKAKSVEEVEKELARLQREVTLRLGDHIYGGGEDRLERVMLDIMLQSKISLVMAECHTDGIMTNLLKPLPDLDKAITVVPVETGDELADFLQMDRLHPESPLSRWCRIATNELLNRSGTDLGMVVYNHYMPGGAQVLVTLASAFGVSVTQRSFSGHPDSLVQWSSTLGLAHLRRWLLVHRSK